jgi:hypothetical protein
VNPDLIVMEKIVCGDAGDNIKSIAKVCRGSKTYKVSTKMWNDIRKSLNITSLEKFFNLKLTIVRHILAGKKFSECCETDVLEMMDYNIRLVWLNEDVIPDTVVMYMNQCEYGVADIPYIKTNYKVLCKRNDKIEQLFDSIQ